MGTGFVFSKAPMPSPGLGFMKYVATWDLLNDGGLETQVWRYLVNIDFAWNGVGQIDCPIPTCFAVGELPHFVGFLDVACVQSQTGFDWRFAFALSHHEGCYSHFANPQLNAEALTPGQGDHGERSYHVVGPKPFVFADPATLPTGTDVAMVSAVGFVRTSGIAGHNFGVATCLRNVGVSPAGIGPAQTDCNCVAAPPPLVSPPIHYHQNVSGFSVCGGAQFVNVPPSPTFPPPINTGFMQTYIGEWQPGIDYPQTMKLLANVGLISYTDPWPPSQVNDDSGSHFTHGVTTIHPASHEVRLWSDGIVFPAQSHVTVQTSFVNAVESRIPIPPPATTTFGITPLWGAPHASSLVWHLAK